MHNDRNRHAEREDIAAPKVAMPKLDGGRVMEKPGAGRRFEVQEGNTRCFSLSTAVSNAQNVETIFYIPTNSIVLTAGSASVIVAFFPMKTNALSHS